MDETTLQKLFVFMKDHPESSQAEFIDKFMKQKEGSRDESAGEQDHTRVSSLATLFSHLITVEQTSVGTL